MGYYTDYKLKVTTETKEDLQEFLNDFENEGFFDHWESISRRAKRDPLVFWGYPGGACKWYNHAEDMKKISAKYPKLTFKLFGAGEDAAHFSIRHETWIIDFWEKVFKNGNMLEKRFSEMKIKSL